MEDKIDRTHEHPGGLDAGSVITVTLSDGFKIDFWEPGLPDRVYFDRARFIRDNE
jgi:hypothetical protein